MKRTRKGFTLIELLIVIAIIGILSSMGMISGTEAANTAKVTNIVDGFEKIGAAMQMYYADNYKTSDANKTNIDDLLAGVKAYVKEPDLIVKTAAVRTYAISILKGTPEQWWLTYTLDAADVATLGAILKTKTTRLGLTTKTDGKTAYDGKATVCYRVR